MRRMGAVIGRAGLGPAVPAVSRRYREGIAGPWAVGTLPVSPSAWRGLPGAGRCGPGSLGGCLWQAADRSLLRLPHKASGLNETRVVPWCLFLLHTPGPAYLWHVELRLRGRLRCSPEPRGCSVCCTLLTQTGNKINTAHMHPELCGVYDGFSLQLFLPTKIAQ